MVGALELSQPDCQSIPSGARSNGVNIHRKEAFARTHESGLGNLTSRRSRGRRSSTLVAETKRNLLVTFAHTKSRSGLQYEPQE